MSWCRPTPALQASHGLNGSTASTISPSPTSTSLNGSTCGMSWWSDPRLAAGLQPRWRCEIADVFPLTPDELSALSFHNPAAFRIDPTTLSPDQVAAMAANFQALKVYDQGQGMRDPKLRRRLARVRIPALVVWGESDGVVDPDYGRAYAQSLPNARFALIPEAGHLPQIEQPERLLTLVWEFADGITATPPVAGSFEKR